VATGTILLPLKWPHFDRTNPPGLNVDNPENRMAFDDTASEIVRIIIRAPDDYASGFVLKGFIPMAGANTGTKVVGVGVAVDAKASGESIGSESFDTENTTEITINNTAETIVSFSLTLTNADSVNAGERMVLKFRRITTGLTGTNAVGDALMEATTLEYTTT